MISEALFYRVQAAIDGRNTNINIPLSRRNKDNTEFPLRRLLICSCQPPGEIALHPFIQVYTQASIELGRQASIAQKKPLLELYLLLRNVRRSNQTLPDMAKPSLTWYTTVSLYQTK